MFLGNSEEKGINGCVLGMHQDDRFAQISFWLPGAHKPETLTAVMDGEQYMIPAVLCRRTDRDVWTYGREALQTAGAGDGVLVDHLLSRALAGERVEVGGEIYEATALLSLFIKRSLSLLGGTARGRCEDTGGWIGWIFSFSRLKEWTMRPFGWWHGWPL